MSDSKRADSSLSASNAAEDVTQETIYTRRVLRFTLGIGLAVAVSAIWAWPLAFIVPVFVAKFLVDRQEPTMQTVYELLISMICTIGLAWLVSFGPTHYPMVLLPLLAMMMLWGYYLFSDPKWNFFATIFIVATLLLPYLSLLQPGAAILVGVGLSFSGVVAVVIFALLHALLPDLSPKKEQLADAQQSHDERTHEAFRALIIAFPVICFFYFLEISGALLTMIFIAILSLQAAGAKSVKVSLFLLVTNGIGGALAVVFYNLLTIVPEVQFYIGMSMLAALFFGQKIYADPAKAPLYAGILSALLVVVGSTASSTDKDVAVNFYLRILQLFLVGVYMIFASFFLESRDWKFLKKRNSL
ncbi:DUF2955 domain-containing protein [Shewanella schlegeliana]|uniref:DUF2955 domain-containing protein n=1 Tax=Shewanella schlegeliana TaxID=190308 RepID=A0ABS1T060_9GAMM|nr:DUF2955 domain-containing protein [Shewanella schlegeliana]MBL4914145.1 DUF2955 domain-containing protein [Shewanella schlegeliana]MCL1110818.1 DUF2955 domain-containing protein [Shewanella schlegeliana]GIU36391.1 hypothetical protein TUM4433_35080 [Shewanella schlegeliana]